jgi:Kef-type K+ transport system membrane component KefB
VLFTGTPEVRGDAPTAAFVLMTAIALSITAVPVLARILADHGMTRTAAGRLALTAAIVIDALSWLVLMLAVGLESGRLEGFLRSVAVLAGSTALALLLRRGLRTRGAAQFCARWPMGGTMFLGGIAIGMAVAVEHLGMTAILGAVLAGLAVPAVPEDTWSRAIAGLTSAGRLLLPIFFVITGITLLTHGFGSASIALTAIATILGIVGKAGGGYLGGRLGGQSHWDSLRIASLMNTRGLTELIVLQIGLSTGILTPPLFLALLVMALVTTALTGPSLQFIDRAELSRAGTVLVHPQRKSGVL